MPPIPILTLPLLAILFEPDFHNAPCEVHHPTTEDQTRNYEQEFHVADISSAAGFTLIKTGAGPDFLAIAVSVYCGARKEQP